MVASHRITSITEASPDCVHLECKFLGVSSQTLKKNSIEISYHLKYYSFHSQVLHLHDLNHKLRGLNRVNVTLRFNAQSIPSKNAAH